MLIETNSSPVNIEPPIAEEPEILEEISIEQLSIDGICGVY